MNPEELKNTMEQAKQEVIQEVIKRLIKEQPKNANIKKEKMEKWADALVENYLTIMRKIK
jgi:hypothetical protein